MRTTCITLFLLGMVNMSLAQTQDSMNTFDSTFAHTVYFWFNNPDNEADRDLFEASLKKFLDNSKFAKTNFIGTPPKATREVVDGSFTYSLIVTFESAEAQEGYQKEQAHLTFIDECKHLWKKVIVYDSLGL
ncbi:Dabb family protein [Flagellimonas algicola]|uniref:Dabb family protein n=2 Tax=Flagellimonas algicola TaxID=2583815 RepID=A0ABY2WI82_9FLAO|nr:Dabb family protein [Allomuricauda algicola]